MKVLLAHNFYQQAGGEDEVYRAEAELLAGGGDAIVRFERRNDEIGSGSFGASIGTACRTFWAWDSAREIRHLIARERPDIAHFYNTFPLISPAAYYACYAYGVPVVQTVQNYRLMCVNALLYRNGRVCELCLGKTTAWHGIRCRCYRGSVAASAVVAGMVSTHRLARTWDRYVDRYIAATEFSRRKLVDGGLAPERVVVKPNFLASPPEPRSGAGNYALFVGRLAPEKGIDTLLEAWRGLGIPLKIAGAGPMRSRLHAWLASQPSREVEYVGWRSREEVHALMRGARFLVFPSLWYEGFPVTIVEAFACGIPVVASNLGSMADVIVDDDTGFLFKPGSARELAASARRLWTDTALAQRLGCNARSEFEDKYTCERNRRELKRIYEDVLGARGPRRR